MSGLYVQSNVQSLVSQNQLNRNLAGLSDILTRLSTGLRINSGKDDPAGLIASELLKSDMVATTKAITNVQRANSMVAIADSAMGQISSLLNDIKGLINESANTGTMTYEQILANQLQVDAALDSIDRIAKTTNYLGKNILDGSLDFQTRGLDRTIVKNLNVYQANFGTQDHVNVGINVVADASRAQLFYDKAGVSQDTVFEIIGNDGSSLVKIAGGQGVEAIADAVNLVSDSTGVRAIVGRDATAGQIFLTSASLDNDINLTALMTGAAAGNYTIKFSAGNSDHTTYTITEPTNGKPGIIDFQLKMQPAVAPSVEKFDESFNGIFTYDISGNTTVGSDDIVVQTSNGQRIKSVEYVATTDASLPPDGVAVTFDKVSGKLQIQYDGSSGATVLEETLKRAINAIEGFEYMGIINNVATPPVFYAGAAADTALQGFLGAATTPGTKSPVDLRANNALDIKAAVPGTKFENTDIMYVKAEGDIFSGTFRLGYQNVYASFTDPTHSLKGYTIVFEEQTAAGVNATLAGTVLTVAIGNDITADVAAVETAIQALGGAWATFTLVDPTKVPIDSAMSAASLAGTTLHLSNVQLNYSDTPAAAAASITLDSGKVKLQITADTVGSQYNDVSIVFEQQGDSPWLKSGEISVTYDETKKVLHVRGDLEGGVITYGTLKAAIESQSPFRVTVTDPSDNSPFALSKTLATGLTTTTDATGVSATGITGSSVIRTGQAVGNVGGDNQTLFITVSETATASDVIDAFQNAKGPSAQIAANFIVGNSVDNNGSGTIFHSLLDTDTHVRLFVGALTGGNSGLQSDVTAKELTDFINNDAVLSKLFRADVARGQSGNGFLTLFDEAAYYGSTLDDNALQFLGPKGSPDILFVTDGPNSQLGISFINNYGSGCVGDDRPVASLNATNVNAAFLVQALRGGSEYDDMVVRMIRLDNNHAAGDSYAVYKDGPSNAMAYCSIWNDPLTDATADEIGKFIVYANQGGEKYNDVSVVVRLDTDQTDKATAYYCDVTKKLIVTVNSGDVLLTDAVAAINNDGTFQAEYDYSFNSVKTGPGIADFSKLVGTGATEAVIGNTGTTGGHTGGVLEVYLGGDNITANQVIDTINNGPTTKNLFVSTAIGGPPDAGTGTIHFRNDNIKSIVGSDGKLRNQVNMLSGILGSDENAQSYMVIHLATDANGNSITTAKDLVKFFDQLTPEQTRGISVSVVRPPGIDNLNRQWTVDSCGNVIETQLCDDPYGLGILKPTYEVDDCFNYFYFPIEFFSYGQDIRAGNAYGSVIDQGGINASLDIRAKAQGPDFNGVGFRYVKLGDPLTKEYAEYDQNSKMITVYVHAMTTAGQVKAAIENSEQTKSLFEVSLPGNGSGVVTLQGNYLIMKGGLYDAGYRGGAAMLGAADADAHRLILESMGEGSRQFVSLRWLDGGQFDVKDAKGNTVDTTYGSDMIATINGMKASADGRSLTLESAMLKLGIILDERVTTGDRVNFTITGGGAVIQMGTDVVSNQQIRFAIQSVNTANLGGASGRLYQLRTGEVADLITSDASRRLADRIINEAIMSVAQTRGRLGAIQRNTLEPQISALQDSLVAISAAEAQISNADFAEESSRLTRAQILVQAGTRTLQIANQFPQYAASLLGG